MKRITGIIILLASIICSGGCAQQYADAYKAYAAAQISIQQATSNADAAYYNMMAARYQADAQLKVAAMNAATGGNNGRNVMFFGSDGSRLIAPIHQPVKINDPDSGYEQAAAVGKAVVWGAVSAVGIDRMFDTWEATAQTASNVTTITKNATTTTETDSSNNSVNVSDSGNRTLTVSDSGNDNSDNSSTDSSDNSVTDDHTDNSVTDDHTDNSTTDDHTDNTVERPVVVTYPTPTPEPTEPVTQ